jgi:hypothetical protein
MAEEKRIEHERQKKELARQAAEKKKFEALAANPALL